MASNNGGKPERNLLDRLNALKRGSASQNIAAKPPVTRTLPLADPRQDVLSDRLRALRNQSSSGQAASTSASRTVSGSAEGADGKLPSPSASEPTLPLDYSAPPAGAERDEEDDANGQMSDLGDDGALEEFLEDLELDFDEGNEEESQQRAPTEAVNRGVSAEDNAKRIAAVLARVRKDSAILSPKRLQGHNAKRQPDEESRGDADSDDDERNQVETDRIVSQALDEVKLDGELFVSHQENDEHRPLSPHHDASEPHKLDQRESSDDQSRPADDTLAHLKDTISSLPAVPDSLPGPTKAAAATSVTGDDFESDISRRLAALRVLGDFGNGGGGGLGLPSAPSFQPAANKPARESKVKSTVGYTDEDQKGWCIVCLADATSICVECDDDAYCEACWRDMHVGPAAAFDATHKRMAFVKERKKKRMLVAA